MTDQIKTVLNVLEENGIAFDIIRHAPVYTIDEIQKLMMPHMNAVAKNLFIRDDKKRNYYIIVMRKDKKADLKSLRQKIGSRPLTFASESDLNRILNLTKGSVTPFGILNDEERIVQVIIDKSFQNDLIGVHPNDNTATVYLETSALISVIRLHGNSAMFVEI